MIDIKLNVKPLSANSMYYNIGRHKKRTRDYNDYQLALLDELRDTTWPFGSEQVAVFVEAGLSARQADLDNILKPLLDTLQGIFNEFNDNKCYYIEATKKIVPKGDEYIGLRIDKYVDGLLPREGSAITSCVIKEINKE